jgi:mRNA interferase MazF
MQIDPKRGEVWQVDLNPARGSEQAKTRPVVVMSQRGIGRSTMRVCVPVVNRLPVHGVMPWCVALTPSQSSGLTKDSTGDASQVRALDTSRFVSKLGALTAEAEVIAAALVLVVGYRAKDQEEGH